MKIFTAITLFSMLLSFGCAKKAENQVTVTISQGLIFGGAALADFSQGGLMLWGSSSSGDSFAHALRGSDQLNLSLPNGQWSFYVMAWQNLTAAELDGSGKIRCALNTTLLNGGDSQIDLTLSEATCAQSAFSGPMGASLSTMQYRQFVCEDITNYGAIKNCSADRNAADRISDPAPVMSVLVRLSEYSTLPNLPVGAGLSRCLPFDATIGSTESIPAGELIIPLGNNPAMRVEFEYHLDSDLCASAPSKVISHQIAAPSPRVGVAQTGPGIFSHFKQITDAQVCAEGRAQLSGFAGGNGTDLFPYIICSAQQLYHLAHQWGVYYANSFRLASSINLLPFIKANAVNNATLPSDFSCWNEGSNWRPLGWSYDGGCAATTDMVFSGNFDGNNHTIFNLRAEHDEASNVGLFSEWSPGVTDRFIRDLIFDKPSIEGSQWVGTVVGKKTGGSIATIANVHVLSGFLEADYSPVPDSYIGGIIGEGNFLGLINVSTRNTEIYHAGNKAGGVFGSLIDATILNQVFSSSVIINRGSSSITSYVGGLGGFVDGSGIGSLSELSHEGAIVGNSNFVGGLFGGTGSLGAPGVLNQAYATTSFTNFVKTPANLNGGLGGLVGNLGTDLDFVSTYFAGHILSACAGAGCPVGMVFGQAGAFTINGDVYVYETPSRTVEAPGDTAGAGSFAKIGMNNSLTSPSLYVPTDTPGISAGAFVKNPNSLPRLISQQHPCAITPHNQALLGQLSAGRGSASAPLSICYKEQFMQISSLPTSPQLHVMLMAPINLSGTYTPINIQSNIILMGHRGLLYGLDNATSPLGVGERRSPIAINEGTILDLQVAGINVGAPTSSGANTVSPFVNLNIGTIDNSHVIGAFLNSGSINVNLAGFVAENSPTGTIFESSAFSTFANTNASASGFVHMNFGSISDITSAPLFDVITASSPSSHSNGLFFQNDGSIEKAEIRGRIENLANVVVQNFWGFGNINNGDISDSHLHSSAQFSSNFNSGNFASVVNNNNSGGNITRIFNEGSFVNYDSSTSTFGPTDAKPIRTNTGNALGIFSTRPSGRMVSSNWGGGPFSCSGPNVLMTPAAFAGVGPFAAIGGIEVISQAWIETRDMNNNLSTYKISSMTNDATNVVISLDVGICPPAFNDANAQINFIQSYATTNPEAEGDVTAGNYVGLLRPQLLDDTYFLTGPWQDQFLDPENNPADKDLIVQAFLERVTSGTSSVNLPPWEYESMTAPKNNRLRLLRND